MAPRPDAGSLPLLLMIMKLVFVCEIVFIVWNGLISAHKYIRASILQLFTWNSGNTVHMVLIDHCSSLKDRNLNKSVDEKLLTITFLLLTFMFTILFISILFAGPCSSWDTGDATVCQTQGPFSRPCGGSKMVPCACFRGGEGGQNGSALTFRF